MTWQVRLSSLARQDIAETLAWTYEHFGRRQHDEYRKLINLALDSIAADPTAIPSKTWPRLHPGARTFHIGRRGRRARHLVVYRIIPPDIIVVGRLLHDARELFINLPDSFFSDEP